MKSFILAAGEGTRMRPLTANLPKPLLPVAGKPFLAHTLEALRENGIRDATVLIGWQGRRLKEAFGRGDALGVRIGYEEQLERLGTAHAVGLARSHVDGAFLAVNGDIVVTPDAVRGLLELHGRVRGPVMAVAEVDDPRPFGVIETRDDRVVAIEEKPTSPQSRWVNAGLFVLDPDIFPLVDATERSPRGEFEFTDTLRLLLEKGDLWAYRMPGEWIDVGQPWDLLEANAALLGRMRGEVHGEVSENATLAGEVTVEEGARVLDGVVLEGPSIVSRGASVGPNAYVRPSTSIGRGAKVGSACEVKNSILMDGAHVPHQNYVGDSILGERCNLGAGTKVANLRLDEASIKVHHRGREVDTGRRKLGVIMGDDVKTGINASIDVGTIVGEGTFIGPGAVVGGVIAPRSRIY